jgi:hypothetical protein
MDDLYDEDIVTWSEQQAALLHRRAAGELVNDADIDWPNVAEEIGDVGRSLWHAVESHLTLALLHDLKADAWPSSLAVPGWRAEARLHRRQARRRFVPSMRQKIDLAGLYSDALAGMPDAIDGVGPRPVAQECPVTLDEMLADED